MFTGLVAEAGRLSRAPGSPGPRGVELEIELSPGLAARLAVGDSLAVSGVCLTVTARSATACTVELSPETLERTTLGDLGAGARVNLEPALRLGDALGGHWVQGHVDGVAVVTGRRDLGEHRVLAFTPPPGLERYIVEKGSVTLDGVSLTVVRRRGIGFEVALVPHTLEVTTLGEREVGDRVNFEADVLAKYVERLAEPWRTSGTGGAAAEPPR
ncbi:MAG TPA: riboflavin synthase [Thermoanaerobaculia bacterium]|nr:riboflavin synthase [Thermoanaerobaculia bacterium]